MAHSSNLISRWTTGLAEETHQMLLPIAGYEKEPLLPLREACQPLRNLLGDELDRNITRALKHSASPKEGLTVDESAAIWLYSMEWKNGGSSLYTVFNRTLRAVDRGQLVPWYRFLKLFLTGFYKLP